MSLARALLGLVFFCLVAWCLSSNRRRFPWRVVIFGLLLQAVLAAWLLGTETGHGVFQGLAELYAAFIARTVPAAALVFGPLADPEEMARVFGPGAGYVFAFAGSGLVMIISFSTIMAILYHLGIMQLIIWCLARLMTWMLGVSGAESLAMAANVFTGQTEAPLVVRPYLQNMTASELNALMTGGFATIAGSVLAVYMGVVGPELGPHLITASVLSAPAAFLMAKIMLPETERAQTAGRVELRIERRASNLVEAAAIGTQDGLRLWLNVIAMLVGFLAVVYVVDWPLEKLGEWVGVEELSLARIFGWVFAPLAWIMGVEGWHDCQLFGSLLGTKVALNEFVGFQQLAGYATDSVDGFRSPRSAAMAAFALCGFANFGSIGIQLGGLTPLVPERRADITRLALRAMLGGACASWMTATVAGVFL